MGFVDSVSFIVTSQCKLGLYITLPPCLVLEKALINAVYKYTNIVGWCVKKQHNKPAMYFN